MLKKILRLNPRRYDDGREGQRGHVIVLPFSYYLGAAWCQSVDLIFA